jgi:His/Glu/Gln/Arg/opine family amino acid ABC transporter permease subunit
MAVSEAVVLVWALFVALLRTAPGRAALPVRFLAVVYVDVFRGIPLIILFTLIGFGLPLTGIPFFSGLDLFELSVLALVLAYGAYVAEVYRAGIDSVHPSQRAAARSLGLSYPKAMWFVVIPQAVRAVIPPLLNDFVSLQKDTALASTIGLPEALQVGNNFAGNNFNYSPVVGVALCFLAITVPLTRLVDYLVARDRRPMQAALEEHEVVCLIGASGSGKSTLLRCLNLLEPIDAGRITLDGEPITEGRVDVNRVRCEVGIVFQSFNLFPHMTVLRNVTLAPRQALGLPRERAWERTEA